MVWQDPLAEPHVTFKVQIRCDTGGYIPSIHILKERWINKKYAPWWWWWWRRRGSCGCQQRHLVVSGLLKALGYAIASHSSFKKGYSGKVPVLSARFARWDVSWTLCFFFKQLFNNKPSLTFESVIINTRTFKGCLWWKYCVLKKK